MKAATLIFNQTMSRYWLLTIFAGIASILIWIVMPFLSHNKESLNDTSIFVSLVTMSQLLFLLPWTNHLRLTINNRMNLTLPGFRSSVGLTVFLFLMITTIIPMILGLIIYYPTLTACLLVIFFGLLIIASNLQSQSMSSVMITFTILFLSSESARVKKNPDSMFMDYLPVQHDSLLIAGIIFLLVIMYYQIKRSPLRKSNGTHHCTKEEFLLQKKSANQLGKWLGQKYLRMKLELFTRLFDIKSFRVSVSLWNNQYMSLSSIRWILAMTLLPGILFGKFIWFEMMQVFFGAGFIKDSPPLIAALVLITLPVIAGFDTSLFARMKSSESFLWLKEPVEGFRLFKQFFFKRLMVKSTVEVLFTGIIFLMLINEFSLGREEFLYFLLTFFSFKLLSITLGFLVVAKELKNLGRFLVGLVYLLYIFGWMGVSVSTGMQSSLPLIGFCILMIGVISIGFRNARNALLMMQR